MSASSCMTNKIQTQEETMLMQKQGIVTILGSGCDANTASASSLRRTLSADMSSMKWLSQNESISPMKKTGSSEELLHSSKIIADSLSSSSSSEDESEVEAERERLEIWSSIQRNKKEEQEKAGAFDMWSSIMSLKDNNEISKSLPVTPYVHPLVKRSKSSLSEKSLEICTESLGSETGSDGLFSSSYPPSETGDAEEDKEEQEQEKVTEAEEEEEEEEEVEEELQLHVPRYNYSSATKKSPPRSFPPPLPSLSSRQASGPSLHMRPHRDNGRLVLQAVSVPSQNNFCVQRQEGRLVLTLADHDGKAKEDADEVGQNEEFEGFEEDDDDVDEDEWTEEEEEAGETESEAKDAENVIENKAPFLSSGITTSNVHRLALMINKPIGLVNRNPKWSDKLNEAVEVEPSHQVAKSLPPRPRVARLIPSTPTASSGSFNLNAYEYYWRTKPTAKASTLPNPQKDNSSSKLIVSGDLKQIPNEQQQLLVLRGKNGDYLVHNLKSCKDSRRSFLFWEPYCIATS